MRYNRKTIYTFYGIDKTNESYLSVCRNSPSVGPDLGYFLSDFVFLLHKGRSYIEDVRRRIILEVLAKFIKCLYLSVIIDGSLYGSQLFLAGFHYLCVLIL